MNQKISMMILIQAIFTTVVKHLRSNQTTCAMKRIEPILIVIAIGLVVIGCALINIFYQ
jgi:hypothetical protein